MSLQWDGTQVIAGSWQGRNATIFESSTGKTVVRLPLPLAPRQFCMSGDGGQLFITGDGMDAVVVPLPVADRNRTNDSGWPCSRLHDGDR